MEVIEFMTQGELRKLYNERIKKEKQCYISEVTQIDASILSKFKKGQFDLYPHLFARLEKYLTSN